MVNWLGKFSAVDTSSTSSFHELPIVFLQYFMRFFRAILGCFHVGFLDPVNFCQYMYTGQNYLRCLNLRRKSENSSLPANRKTPKIPIENKISHTRTWMVNWLGKLRLARITNCLPNEIELGLNVKDVCFITSVVLTAQWPNKVHKLLMTTYNLTVR